MASLAAQTHDEFEIVAVDDGSRDATAATLARWAARDERLQVISTARSGLVASLQAAAAQAHAPILARMDGDDIALPERFEQQLAYLRSHPDVAACGTCVRYFPRRRLRDGARRYERWLNALVTPEAIEREVFVECPIPHPTLMIRREAFDAVGGYRDCDWPEDYDLILRLYDAGYRLGKVARVLLEWRERPNRTSRTDPRYAPDAFRRLKARFLTARSGGRPVVVWGAGPVGKAFARTLRAAGHVVTAFVDLDPRKIGQTIHDAPVIAPGDIGRYREAYVVAAVGSPGAREEIRAALSAAGRVEGPDWCAVA